MKHSHPTTLPTLGLSVSTQQSTTGFLPRLPNDNDAGPASVDGYLYFYIYLFISLEEWYVITLTENDLLLVDSPCLLLWLLLWLWLLGAGIVCLLLRSLGWERSLLLPFVRSFVSALLPHCWFGFVLG
jgi:hypothetical protein